MTMFRNNSILKSILFDAFTNYLEYNSTLAHWRGLTNTKIRTSPIGYPNGSALNRSKKRGAEAVEDDEEFSDFTFD
jgi:hypothetical protein